jgi:hypothetical protein
MRPRKPFRIWLVLSLVFTSCAGPRIKGPTIRACFVQEINGGIECAMKDQKQVFLRWVDVKEKFLSGFDRNVLLPYDDFMALVEWGHRK